MNASDTRSDQRRSRRFRQQVDVDVVDKLGVRRGRAIDIARHGLFVAIVDPPQNRHLVQLVLHLPDGPLSAAASVSRTLPGQGVGLSLFALSSDAKRRWDAFITRAQQNEPHPEGGVVNTHDMPAFVVKLRTIERLRDYLQTHIAVGGTVLFTPVLPPAGSAVQLLVVHPISEAEFPLFGRVHRAVTDPPKRLEILFERTDMVAFARFVDSGRPPESAHTIPPITLVPEPAPVSPSPTPSPRPAPISDDFEIEIADEDAPMEDDPIDWDLRTSDLPVLMGTSVPGASKPPERVDDIHANVTLKVIDGFADDDDETITRRTGDDDISDELLIDDTVPAADPGLRPTAFRLACEVPGCPSEPYTVELGPCGGVLGLVADQVAYWSPDSGRVISVPRLLSAEARRVRFHHYVERGGSIDDVVSLATFLAAADLAESPRHPMTSEPLRSSRAVERLLPSARRAAAEDTPATTRIRCPHCGVGHLVVESA